MRRAPERGGLPPLKSFHQCGGNFAILASDVSRSTGVVSWKVRSAPPEGLQRNTRIPVLLATAGGLPEARLPDLPER